MKVNIFYKQKSEIYFIAPNIEPNRGQCKNINKTQQIINFQPYSQCLRIGETQTSASSHLPSIEKLLFEGRGKRLFLLFVHCHGGMVVFLFISRGRLVCTHQTKEFLFHIRRRKFGAFPLIGDRIFIINLQNKAANMSTPASS